MTYKAAVAGPDFGGGKSVIAPDNDTARTHPTGARGRTGGSGRADPCAPVRGRCSATPPAPDGPW
ncbi:hypothetical protein ACFZA4_21595 [Streptomyces antimycoticus]|uniref:hypothetical protein n=1 Tax=Streptomyces antimycoticus TaxID=68175 RepID=UPI0036E28668